MTAAPDESEAPVEADAFETALAAVDSLRRWLRDGPSPLADAYVEGARGALHNAREAALHARVGATAVADLPAAGMAVRVTTASPLCSADLPADWRDDVPPARPDLGADLVASEGMRDMSRGVYLGGMLATALAHHAWLHVASGQVWSTDRSGAAALVGALSQGRAIAAFGYGDTLGALDVRVVSALADIGWRRFRSPRYDGPLPT